MRSSLAALALALLLVSAGCSSPAFDGGRSPATSAAEPTAESTATSGASTDALASRSSASTAAAANSGPNPWGTDPIVVGVVNEAEPDRSVASLVRGATSYWEEHDERYLGHPTAFEVRPDAENPDIVVRLVSDVPDCGVGDAVGCAPLINDSRQIDRPETIWVRGGLSDSSTELVLEHELGHALGLTHADAPAEVMAAEAVLHTQPRPDAVDRAFPWNDSTFTVYVDDRNATDPDAVREQVRRAMTYYESDPPGAPANLTFRFVDSPEAADVGVRFSETSPCGEGAASCFETRGTDPDGDGAIERYTRLRIVLVGLDSEATGWHVGYWFAAGLGAEDDAEKPPPFRDASHDERRGEWWE